MGRKSKRSLEIDEEKISPPSKMSNRGVSGAAATEILAKLEAIEARFTSLEKEMAEITRVVKEIDTLRKEVDLLKQNCEGYQRLEIELKKRSVLVKGVKFHTKEKYETRAQTKAALAELFGRIDMRPHLVDYQRLGGLRPNEDGSKVSIRIQFMDVDQKMELFERMREKGRELQDITILTDFPSFQMTEFKTLSGLGFRIRTEKPGTKTRIVPKGLGLILQTRSSPAERWTHVSS
jgi:hypothetical protein